MLAKQITSLRARSGMTQQQLAKELHVGPSAIGMYEQGRRVPSIEMLVQMADLFGVSLDYLITGKEFSGMAISENGVPTQPDCR
jgi:transcriptional regulator with XRE-family HTH domain